MIVHGRVLAVARLERRRDDREPELRVPARPLRVASGGAEASRLGGEEGPRRALGLADLVGRRATWRPPVRASRTARRRRRSERAVEGGRATGRPQRVFDQALGEPGEQEREHEDRDPGVGGGPRSRAANGARIEQRPVPQVDGVGDVAEELHRPRTASAPRRGRPHGSRRRRPAPARARRSPGTAWRRVNASAPATIAASPGPAQHAATAAPRAPARGKQPAGAELPRAGRGDEVRGGRVGRRHVSSAVAEADGR